MYLLVFILFPVVCSDARHASACLFLLPYLDRFHRQYPAIHIQIISGRSHKVLGLLQSGKVDIAFASTPQEGASLETFPCLATHSIFVAGAEYPCDFDHVYTLEEIARFPLILLERKASSRIYVEQFFQQHGVSIKPEIELGSHNLLISLALVQQKLSLAGQDDAARAARKQPDLQLLLQLLDGLADCRLGYKQVLRRSGDIAHAGDLLKDAVKL